MKCDFCEKIYELQDVVKLTGCKHSICKNCMTSLVEATIEEAILCPCIEEETNTICDKLIPNKDIKAGVPDSVYNTFLQRSLDVLENDSKEVVPDKNDRESTDENEDKEQTIPELEKPKTFKCVSCSNEYEIQEKANLFDTSESFCKKCILQMINKSTEVKDEKPVNTFVCEICNNEYDLKEKVDLDDITKSFCKMCISKIVKSTTVEEKIPKTFNCTICLGVFDISEKADFDDECKSFCKTCIANIVKKTAEVKPSCPYPCCNPSTPQNNHGGNQNNPGYQECCSGRWGGPRSCPPSQETPGCTGNTGRGYRRQWHKKGGCR